MTIKYFDESFLMTNGIRIEPALFYQDQKRIVMNVVFEKIVDIKTFDEFLLCLKMLQNDDQMKKIVTKFEVNYQYKNNQFDDQTLKDYMNYFIDLSKDNALSVSKEFITVENGSIFILEMSNALDLQQKLSNMFNQFGLNVDILIKQLDRSQIEKEKNEQKEEDRAILEQMVLEQSRIAEENKRIVDAAKSAKRTSSVLKKDNVIEIKSLPVTEIELDAFKMENGLENVTVKGELVNKDFIQTRNEKFWANLTIYDGTDSIVLKKYVDRDEKELYEKFNNGDILLANGPIEYDTFAKEVVVRMRKVEILSLRAPKEPNDKSEFKRVELHLHTNMSALDGVASVKDYVDRAKLNGYRALAFTDHDGVYAYHTIMKECQAAGIKPIYGVELGFVDEKRFNIAYTSEDIDLKNASFVVFDLETTGFSVVHDAIIQIGAMKLERGGIVSTFNEFVNPQRHIPNKITALTSIDDNQVKDARLIDEVIKDFIDYIGDSILVAQNASFDVSFLYENMRRLGIEHKEFPVIDTMQLARTFYAEDLKRFDLKTLAKYFKVNQEHHHLADDDTRVTANIFMQMLQTLYKNNIYNYKDINSAIKEEEAYKHIVPSHINLLVKNQEGYKNLFKIISDSLTEHYHQESRVLKRVLDKYREGILVGSGCKNGEVFENALNKSDEELERAMSYYDYIEVQPYDIYRDMLQKRERDLEFVDDIDYEKMAKDAITRIIKTAEKLGKIVVATSDCHYVDKEDKFYRDICIATPKIGGGLHPLALCKRSPDQHFRTTDEMLKNFHFLGVNKATEIVIVNTNKIADMIEDVTAFRNDLYSPHDDEFAKSLGVPSIEKDLLKIVYDTAHQNYGENLPQFVTDRLDKELNSIIKNGYSPIYYMAYLLVKKSNDDGFVVGSRGSVGSSFVATMMNITEVNPLPPHFYCPSCGFNVFKFNEEEKKKYPLNENQMKFDAILQATKSGFDLPKANCPCCGKPLKRDGQDIPFETFLGFKGDKTPDIDLNFSGLYQNKAHEYIRTLMGVDRAFRAGTIGTVADQTAFMYVSKYFEERGQKVRRSEINRIAKHIVGVRRTTGQHPGGIVVVPSYKDIYDVTPIQYPADKTDNDWRTTHFEYHDFEANLLKLDILGHDDPTTLRYLFDYVEAHPDEFPFKTPKEVPLDDENVYKMFNETEVLGLKPSDINSEVATYALPEFGTFTTRQMLEETRPKNFAELVKISGLAHGTNVWSTNTQELVAGRTSFGKIPFDKVIGCRDDIMVQLIADGLEPSKAFEIMEFVRKGKPAKSKDPNDWKKWDGFKEYMTEKEVPQWYIWSCNKIEYMFPKAHAVAYVLSAMRIAWFKYYKPLVFYSAFFSIRAEQFEPEIMLNGVNVMRQRINELQALRNKSAKEDALLTMYQVAVEMLKRGYHFLPVDIKLSDADKFKIEGNALRLPFIAVPGLGLSVANDIVLKREEKEFSSKDDVMKRTRLNKTLFELFETMHAFSDLIDKEEEEDILSGLFEFDEIL